MKPPISSCVEPLPLVDLVLHKVGRIEAHEATYQNKVFLSYTINTETKVLKLSTVRTVLASRGQGLSQGALKWLHNLAAARRLSLEA